MKLCVSLLWILPLSASTGCMPITGDRILGRDLARAEPRFAIVPASITVGAAPAPGTRRMFAPAELGRIARANGIQLDEAVELCFEVPLRQMSDEEISAAMRRSLPDGVELSIVDRAKTEVPVGEVVFPAPGLAAASASDRNVQMWRGYVRYTETRKMDVWARVSITQTITAVVAVKDLALNVPIDAAALHVVKRNGPLLREPVALRTEDVLGHIPKRPVKAGSVIPLASLDRAPVVHRGEPVKVEVLCGPARLQLDAIAEREARDGDVVELRNPVSGKTFRARLEGQKAMIVIAMGQTL